MRKVSLLLSMILLFYGVSSAEVVLEKPQAYRPTYELSLGYRLTWLNGDRSTIEYIRDRDFPAFEGVIEVYPLPHRFHLKGSFLSDKEYYIDTGYAYSDLLLSRYIGVGFVHNEEPKSLSPDPSSSFFNTYSNHDNNCTLYTSRYDLFLRLKYPDYPFHLFTRLREYHHSGTVQQRYMLGFFTTGMDKYSEKRSIKSSTREIEIGSNAHLGPVEVEYTHTEKRVNLSAGEVLYHRYPQILSTPEDTYPHNLIPELESSHDLIRLHTSYTGRIVASLSARHSESKNRFSNAGSKMRYYASSFSYVFSPRMTLFLKGYYIERDTEDLPVSVLRGLNNTITYPLRPAPDSIKRKVSVGLRYRPFRNTGVITEFSLTDRKLSETEGWHLLNGDTTIQTLTVRAYTRVFKGFPLRAEYTHLHYKNPLYNSEPNSADRLKLQVSYQPIRWLSGMLMYLYTDRDRDSLIYYDRGLQETLEVEGTRRVYHHNLTFVLSLLPTEEFTLTSSIGYIRDSLRGPLVVNHFKGDGSHQSGPLLLEDYPYRDESIIYTVGADYRYSRRVSISLEVARTLSRGGVRAGMEFNDLDEISRLKIAQWDVSLRSSILLGRGIYLEPSFLYARYEDRHRDDNSGEAFQVLTFVKKSFR